MVCCSHTATGLQRAGTRKINLDIINTFRFICFIDRYHLSHYLLIIGRQRVICEREPKNVITDNYYNIQSNEPDARSTRNVKLLGYVYGKHLETSISAVIWITLIWKFAFKCNHAPKYLIFHRKNLNYLTRIYNKILISIISQRTVLLSKEDYGARPHVIM